MLSLAAEDLVLNLLNLWQPNYFGGAQSCGKHRHSIVVGRA